MGCIQCKETHNDDNEQTLDYLKNRNLNIIGEIDNTNPYMIQDEGNCFPVIEYTETQIIFNITETNPVKKFGTCLVL